jgi:hypothetical protein
MAYWVSVYSVQTWKESLDHPTLSGFTTSVGSFAKRIKVGDVVLCYLAHGVSRFVGLKLVTGDCYRDDAPLFGKYEGNPWRITVEPIVLLTPETAVPIKEIKGLSFDFDKGWGYRVRKALNTWDDADGQIVEQAIRSAQINPKYQAVPSQAGKPQWMAKSDRLGSVSIPPKEVEEPPVPPQDATSSKDPKNAEGTPHSEIQRALAEMGIKMGYGVWIPLSDRGKPLKGGKLKDGLALLDPLPALGLDEATHSTVRHIDVMWLKGSALVAAFEIESTTSIYSGLLRMSDLQVMQPLLSIPIYIVAPDDRFDDVVREINRPTFRALSKPLNQICKIVRFSRLREAYAKHEEVLHAMTIKIVDHISDSPDLSENLDE